MSFIKWGVKDGNKKANRRIASFLQSFQTLVQACRHKTEALLALYHLGKESSSSLVLGQLARDLSNKSLY